MDNNKKTLTTREIWGINIEYDYLAALEKRIEALEARLVEQVKEVVVTKTWRKHKKSICGKNGRIANKVVCRCEMEED